MSLPTHRRLLQLKKKTKKNTKTEKKMTSFLARHCPLQPKKKNLDVGFSWVVGDDDKPHHCLLAFFSSLVEDNVELGGSSLFFIFFPHLQKMTMS